MRKRLEKFFLYFTIVFGLLLSSQSVLALGVSPAIINVPNLANNIEVKKTMRISRANPSKTQYMNVAAYGTGAKYIRFSTTTFALPKGQDSVPLDFFILPVAAPNGQYEAEIAFNTVVDPTEASKGGNAVSMRIGVTGILRFEVIDRQVIDFTILKVYTRETEVGQPLVFYYTLENKGNVEARPDRAEYKIVDKSDSTHIYTGTLAKEVFTPVPPAQNQTSNFAIRIPITQGDYNVEFSFFSEGKSIFSSDNTFLTIFAAGTLAQKAEIKKIDINGEMFEPGDLVKFDGTLFNTGEISIEPVMYVEIEKDKKSVDILRSEKKILLNTQESTFSVNFKPQEKGEYTAKVVFEYGIYKTEPKVFTFKVGKLNIPLIIGIGVGVLLIILLLIIIAKKIRNRGDKNSATPAPTPAVVPAPVTSVAPPVVPISSSTITVDPIVPPKVD